MDFLPSPEKKISVALQGSGSHGAFSWGVLDKLLEDGRFFIEGFSSTSSGAMTAVAYLQGFLSNGKEGARESLANFWKTLSALSVFSAYRTTWWDRMVGYFNLDHSLSSLIARNITLVFSPYQWNPFKLNPLPLLFRKCFSFEELRSYTAVKVFVCAAHVTTGKLKIFTNQDLCEEVLLATSCLPSYFHAAQVEGEFYWDGGLVGNPAIFPLINRCKAQDILVVQIVSQTVDKLPMTLPEINDRLLEMSENLTLMRELRSIFTFEKFVNTNPAISTSIEPLHIHLVRNEKTFSLLSRESSLNTDWDFIQYLFRWGRKTAEHWIDRHFADVGVRSSANIKKHFVREE